MRQLAGLFGVVLALSASVVSARGAETSAPGGAWGLFPLMASLRQVKTASAHFVEDNYVGMLTKPLETSGTLSYVAPGRLEKITLEPKPESIVLNEETLSGTRSNGEHFSVALGDHPEIGALVEAIRSTMAGDLPTLERYYWVSLEGGRSDWHLSLIPKAEAIRDKVDRISITGADNVVKAIEIHEKDGDRSEMIVTSDNLTTKEP